MVEAALDGKSFVVGCLFDDGDFVDAEVVEMFVRVWVQTDICVVVTHARPTP